LLIKNYSVDGVDIKSGVDINSLTDKTLSKYDVIINLAGSTSVWNEDAENVIWNNINGWVHVYNICKSLNIKYIYASSSCSVNITSVYGLSKRFADEYFMLYPYNNGVGLRLHNVYGCSGREDTLFGKCMNNNSVILYNNGLNKRYFTYIDDVCNAIEKAIYLDGGRIYNVYCPVEKTVLEFVNEVKKYKYIDIQLVSDKREKDKEIQIIDITLENIIGRDYTTIEEGIKNSILAI
jgi:UDP-glucuronate 4-epimerase